MCDTDVDSIVTYLSQKLNRIFYDREFVINVNEDLQFLLNKKSKCALVFPVLEPIFFKAVQYQAKIYNLGTFYIGFGRKRACVICQKEYLLEKSDQIINESEESNNKDIMNKEDESNNAKLSNKKSRPPIQLYVPPAQRVKKKSVEKQNKTGHKYTDKTKSKKQVKKDEIIPKLKNLKIATENTDNILICKEETLLPVMYDKNETYLKKTINCNENIVENNLEKLLVSLPNIQNDIDHSESLTNVQYIMQILLNKIDEKYPNEYFKTNKEIIKNNLDSEDNKNKLCHHSNSKNFDEKSNLLIKTTVPEKEDEMDKEKEEMRRAKKQINRKSRPIMKYIDIDNDTLDINNVRNKEQAITQEDGNLTNWEDMFTDDGEINEKFALEISKHIGQDAKVYKVSKDYSSYQENIGDLDHVIEIYDFPSTFQTHDIMQLFSVVNNDTMYVKWVDDTHALLVLSSPAKAQRALQVQSDLIKSRPLCDASSLSITTAYKSDLKPAMKRPQTNLLTARRLINTHLGTKGALNKEVMEHEKKLLREAREQRRKEKQNEKDAWEGNPRPSTA